MSDSSIEHALVLELPPPLEDEELGLGLDVELDPSEEATETVDLDEGVVIDIGGHGIDTGDELSWLDAGEDADDLDVGGNVDDASDGWLDDRPMDLDLGFDPETTDESGASDQGAEGLDEPTRKPSADDDSVDLPPMPVTGGEEAEEELDL